MPGIRFNYLTKEIELKGSESFIESNFNKIQDLLIESFGVRKKMIAPGKTMTNDEMILAVKGQESQTNTEIKRHELSAVSPAAATTATISPEISHKATRPPLRKYIRKVGSPGHQKIVVEVVEQKSNEISLESLREKFGLSGSKIGAIIRDAEKFGKVRRGLNGSYAWT